MNIFLHFQANKILKTLKLAVCLTVGISHAAERYTEHDTTPPSTTRKFVWPIKIEFSKFFAESKKKPGAVIPFTTQTNEAILLEDQQIMKKLRPILDHGTADNSPFSGQNSEIKLSGTKTIDSDVDYEPAPTIVFLGRSKSREKLETNLAKGTLSFDPEFTLPKLKTRTYYHRVSIVLPEDSAVSFKLNKKNFGKLSHLTYKPTYPESGSVAFDSILKDGFFPDIVFTDLNMPEINPKLLSRMLRFAPGMKNEPSGIIFAQALRNVGYIGPIIAVTSNFKDVDIEGTSLYKHKYLFEINGEVMNKIINTKEQEAIEKIKQLLNKYKIREGRTSFSLTYFNSEKSNSITS